MKSTTANGKIPSRFGLALVCGAVLSMAIGCSTYLDSKKEDISAKGTAPFDVNLHPLNKTVCDPFDNGDVGNLESGVKASLHYRGKDQPRWYTVNEYIEKGLKSEQTLFFSEINVPTRLFSKGFPTETNDIVKTDAGDKLFEYFALHFEGRLRLGPEDEPGLYELAILSDDGTLLSFNEGENGELVVENDGDTPTRLGCGETVAFNRESLVSFDLKYYQGPRNHISVIPLWRRIDESTKAEPSCGKAGNELYFDYNNDSKPQQAYKDLLARGWKPWGKANYVLPKDGDVNPCYPGEAPLITEAQFDYDLDAGLKVSWNTNIPATSQVLIKNKATNEETLTDSDNVLRTSHSIELSTRLDTGEYEIRAISISATYGKTISAPMNLTVF